MCGIVGFTGHRQAAPILLEGLKKLESLPAQDAPAGTQTDRLRVIEAAMDYGLIEVEPGTECPKDALTICRLLGMDERILEKLP